MRRIGIALGLAGALVLHGCGGEHGGKSNTRSSDDGRDGGKLTVLYTDDVDFIDPGMTYYQPGYRVAYATQRPLYSWRPDDAERPAPDLAESQPEISRDGRTVTVRIRPGLRFSPPVDREVTSADVKYAIERGFFTTVASGYAGIYFGDLAGAEQGVDPG